MGNDLVRGAEMPKAKKKAAKAKTKAKRPSPLEVSRARRAKWVKAPPPRITDPYERTAWEWLIAKVETSSCAQISRDTGVNQAQLSRILRFNETAWAMGRETLRKIHAAMAKEG